MIIGDNAKMFDWCFIGIFNEWDLNHVDFMGLLAAFKPLSGDQGILFQRPSSHHGRRLGSLNTAQLGDSKGIRLGISQIFPLEWTFAGVLVVKFVKLVKYKSNFRLGLLILRTSWYSWGL